MENPSRKVGIILAAPPASPRFSKALLAAKSGLEHGAQVYLYAIDSGVEGLDDERFLTLKESGAKIFACAYSVQQRALTPRLDATLAGLTVLSDIISSTDEFHSFI